MVERLLAKEKVEGSNPFFRSTILSYPRLLWYCAMATTSATTFTEDLRADIQAALESGVPREELLGMVNIAYLEMAGGTTDPQAKGNGHNATDLDSENQGLPVYDVLPPGLIDLPYARKKYGSSRERFANWVKNGRLKVVGRLRAPAPGGGYLVVAEEELITRLKTPPNRGGRPRKIRADANGV